MTRYLLDITRTISRIGRGFATGIDRVETEYLKFVLNDGPDNLFVAKVGGSYVLLGSDTVLRVLANIEDGGGWGLPMPVDAMRLKLSWLQRCACSFIKRNALKKTPFGDAHHLFENIELNAVEYLNIGHSNLSTRFFQTLKDAGCKNIRVFIHDNDSIGFSCVLTTTYSGRI